MHKTKRLKESMKIFVKVEARGYDARYIQTYKDYLIAKNRGLLDKVTIWHDFGKNRIVDGGVQQLIDLMLGSNVLYPSHCQNGTGNAAVTAGDIDLQTPLTPRVAVNYKYRSGLSLKIDTFFDKNTENGTWAESAIFTALTGVTMLCRRLYTSTFVKSTANTATVIWTWTFAPQ